MASVTPTSSGDDFRARPRSQRVLVASAVVLLLVVATMSAAVLLNPSVTPIESRLLVSFQGSVVGDRYLTGSGEHAMGGPVGIAGARIPTPGVLAASGPRSAITWPAKDLGPAGTGQEVLTEIVVAPDALTGGGTLIDVAGSVRLEVLDSTRIRVVAGRATADFELPKAQRRNGLPMRQLGLYSALDDAGSGLVTVFDERGALAPPISVSGAATSTSSVVFASGLTGQIYGVGVSTGADTRSQQLSTLPCTAVPLDPIHRVAVTTGECQSLLLSKASALRPTQRQFDWQELGLTAFVHFGVNTFTGKEWGAGDEDPNAFAPSTIDTDQWARVLRDNGFRMAILTVKHHDGFLLYPSRYTTHDVGSSNWRGGAGDVVGSFVRSARRFGLRVGVYLSPADQNQYTHGVYANGSKPKNRTIPTLVDGDDRAGRNLPTVALRATDYGAYFLNQLYEVLSQYGPIDEVWFDGAQGNIPAGSVEDYDYGAYFTLIRLLAPHAVIAVCGPDVRWVGNESGLAREDEWSPVVVEQPRPGVPQALPSLQSAALGSASGLYAAAQNLRATNMIWYPAEADVSIRAGWFFHPDQEPKSVAELTDIYYGSTGRNAVLLLNVPPDRTGRLSEADVARLGQWRSALRQDMPEDLALGARAMVGEVAAPEVVDGDMHTSAAVPGDGGGVVRVDLPEPARVDRVVLSEDIVTAGQQVSAFAVDAMVGGQWRQLVASGTIGYQKNVAVAAPVESRSFRVRVVAARGPVRLSSVALYSRAASPPAVPNDYFVDCSAVRPGPGREQAPMNRLAQLRAVDLPASATVHIRSSTACVEPLELWGYGVDGAPARVTSWGAGTPPVLASAGNRAAADRLARQGWAIDGVTIVDDVPRAAG